MLGNVTNESSNVSNAPALKHAAKANLNSEAAINASLSLKTSSDIIGDSYSETEYSQVDFKELFARSKSFSRL